MRYLGSEGDDRRRTRFSERAVVAVLLAGFVFQSSTAIAQQGSPEITADEVRAHIRYLASDNLEGRASGSEGNQKAAAYIAEQLKNYGLKPGAPDGSYFQKFDFVSAVKIGPHNTCILSSEAAGQGNFVLRSDTDFRPLGFTTNDSAHARLVFAGYGISAPDDDYDDYATVDVAGKVAVVLRYGPDGNDPHSKFTKHTSFRNKARTAREKGAIGLIIVSGPRDDEEDDLIKLSFDHAFASSGIVVVSMTRAALEPILPQTYGGLGAIQDSIKKTNSPVTFEFDGVNISLRTDVVKVNDETANVLATLEGSDPDLKNEYVVIGAHFDHLGYGGPGSGSLTPDVHEIHNGADDNASGTAGVLELAQAFASQPGSVKRSLLFIFFSGEELGTLGSAYYVNNPAIPLSRTVAMINLDMVGRIENKALTVYGTGTSPAWDGLLARHNIDSLFTLKEIPDGIGPSDHSQFYAKDIPVLFFFTGTHGDYHKPSDDWDKINYPGEESVLHYIYAIAREVAGEMTRPVFAKVQSSGRMGGGDSRGFSVTLGIVPDYGDSGEGMRIGTVRPNGPAEKAGLLGGDVIVKMAQKTILNIYDYMAVLGELKAGDEVEVEVLRDGKRVTAHAVMTKR